MGIILFIDTQTLILILIAFVVLIIWGGPSKIPQLARSFGQAVREFRRGASESEPEPELVEVARRLGIDPTGKTRDELLTEINKALSQQRTSATAKPSVDPRSLRLRRGLALTPGVRVRRTLLRRLIGGLVISDPLN